MARQKIEIQGHNAHSISLFHAKNLMLPLTPAISEHIPPQRFARRRARERAYRLKFYKSSRRSAPPEPPAKYLCGERKNYCSKKSFHQFYLGKPNSNYIELEICSFEISAGAFTIKSHGKDSFYLHS